MNSVNNLGSYPAAIPIAADDILEFHAARLLLLFRICGTKDKIDGLTKMAKLDFFVRYPQFFDRVCAHLRKVDSSTTRVVESSMVRHHYGPWDKRYYHVLAYLEGKNLITVRKVSSAFQFELTPEGRQAANALRQKDAFKSLEQQMKVVKRELGPKSGSVLKKLIYQVFAKEVAGKSLGEVIT
jgi:DNA-binding PadR family transcriptional regulator